MSLPQSLAVILNPAYAPCPHFSGACKGVVKDWKPEQGHVPRGYFGKPERAEDVKLVVVLAEPADPCPGENYSWITGSQDVASVIAERISGSIFNPNSAFSRNLATILKLCWMPLTLEEGLRHTWVTESVLCSANAPCASIAKGAEQACMSSYLIRQLQLFPTAFLLALGRKAYNRLRSFGYTGAEYAPHPSPPCGNWHSSKAEWEKVARKFEDWRKKSGLPD
jgi:hypothetical protein